MKNSARLSFVLAAMAMLATTAPNRAEPFRIGESAPANTFLAIWMARDAGFYQSRGLDAEVVPMTGGRDMGEAFAAGRLDAMHIGLSSVVRANALGADIRAFGSLSNVIRFTLFGKPGVKTSDVKGGTIGISSLGSESDATIDMMLARIGLARADVSIGPMLPALVDLAPENIPWLFSALVARRDKIASNRDALLRFLKATIEGNRLAIANEAKAKEVLARELKLTDPKVIDVSYADFKAQTPVNVELTIEGARAIVERVAKPGASKRLEDYVDTSLGDALKAEGFYK